MNEEVWGVLFEDSDVEYIIAAFESEEEASEYAQELHEKRLEELTECYPMAEEFKEAFRNYNFYPVAPIARDLVDFGLLERGFAHPLP